MKRIYPKLIILISIAILCLGLIIILNFSNSHSYSDFDVSNFSHIIVPASENTGINYDIVSFKKDTGLVLFLPCRADLSSLTFYAADSEGNYLSRYVNDFTTTPFAIGDYPVMCMQSALPSLEISVDENITTMAEVEADVAHETRAYGDLVLSVSDFDVANYGFDKKYKSKNSSGKTPHSMSLKGRGQSSWEDDKKPFLINLEEDVSLLSMPKGDKWVLLANTVDHSLLRNEVLFNFAKDLGIAYTPGIQNVDLFINGEYRGCYSLCSKIEISNYRVDINEKKDYFYRWGIASGDYRELPKTDLWNQDNYVELVNSDSLSDSKREEAFEIANQLISDFDSGSYDVLEQSIDIDSYIKYYWLSEISKNTDATIRSVYSYYDHNDKKMHLIAPWDLDRTIGTVEPFEKEADYLLPTEYCAMYDKWLAMLMNHSEFKTTAVNAYHEYVSNILGKSVDQIDSRILRIYPSANMNFTRWDYLERPLESYSNKIAYFMGDSSYESEIGWLKEWLRQRKEWLDENVK